MQSWFDPLFSCVENFWIQILISYMSAISPIFMASTNIKSIPLMLSSKAVIKMYNGISRAKHRSLVHSIIKMPSDFYWLHFGMIKKQQKIHEIVISSISYLSIWSTGIAQKILPGWNLNMPSSIPLIYKSNNPVKKK